MAANALGGSKPAQLLSRRQAAWSRTNTMGFKPTSSGAKQAIATLRQYGLLEPRGNSQMSVSALALKLMMPESESQKCEAANEAFLNPSVFGELAEKFNSQIPSEGVIVPTLAQDGFNKDAAERVAKAYIASASWVKELQNAGKSDSKEADGGTPEGRLGDHIDPIRGGRRTESASREWFRLAIGDAGDLVIYVRAGLLPAAGDLQNAITVLGALAATLSSGARQVEGELLPRDQTPRLERG